jgi:FtsZ-interacting cell division protein ZipA
MKPNLKSFFALNIYPSGIELDLTMKGLIAFLILVVTIVIIILICIYRNRKKQEEEESNKKQKRVKEKRENDPNEELKKFRVMKIDNVLKQALGTPKNKENLENDNTKDQSPSSCKSFIEKLNDIGSERERDKESIKDLRHKQEDENNSELKMIKKNSSLKSNQSKVSINKFLKKNALKHVSQYDSDNRSSPESSFYIEEFIPNKKGTIQENNIIINDENNPPVEKPVVMPFELNEKMDMIDKKDVKIIAEESKKEAGVSLEFNNNMVENGETSAKIN